MKIYIVSKYNPDLCYTEDKVFTSFYKAQEYYDSMRKSIQKEADASNAAHHEAVTKDGGFQQKDGYSILSSCHYYNFYGEFTYEWGEWGFITFKEVEAKEDEDSFRCVVGSRADFEERGYDTSHLSDKEMERIFSKIGEILVGYGGYWEAIDEWGSDMPHNEYFSTEE